MQAVTYQRIVRLAIPVMLAQVAVASTGVVDTLVIGYYGDATWLAAVGVASVVINFIYWGFGFLRMSTTGLTAQAMGAARASEAAAVLQRAAVIGLVFGVLILALGPLLRAWVFTPFAITSAVAEEARAYWDWRLWGAPALLVSYGISGFLLGSGKTRQLLQLQIVLNGVNIGLDLWFVAGLKMGPAGVGLGTALAEWVALSYGVWVVREPLRQYSAARWTVAKVKHLFSANRDILIRTLSLLFIFAWFVRSGAQQGTAQLAANEFLLQFVTVAAFVLDGFAFVAEKEIGEAIGARSRAHLLRAMRVTTQLAVSAAIVMTLLYYGVGWLIIDATIAAPAVRELAAQYLWICALIPVLGVLCWQLDGFFIGATQGKALRNAAIVATTLYVLTDWLLGMALGNLGVWLAFAAMYLYRALALGWYLPGLIRQASRNSLPAS